MSADILIFVEDPGAANFIGRSEKLSSALEARGLSVHVATRGIATEHLRQSNARVAPVPDAVDASALLDQIKPRLVAVGTSENRDTLGLHLVAAARTRKLPTLGLVDSTANAGFRFRGKTDDPLRWCPDRIAVPDQATRDEFMLLGLPEDRIVVTGHPHWDDIREFRISRSADRRRAVRSALPAYDGRGRIVVFAAELSTGMDPEQFRISEDYTLTGSGRSTRRTEVVLDEFVSALGSARDAIYLVLRLHPKNVSDDFEAHGRLFDYVSDKEPALDILAASDAVVGMTSMLLIEAALMGKPTLSILPRVRESQWLPTIAAGITPCATHRARVEYEVAVLTTGPRAADDALLDRTFPPGALGHLAQTISDLLR